MDQYHKIDTVYKRTPDGKLLLGEWSRPEFEYLKDCRWVGTEKVDGTNIRVIWRRGQSVEFKGKTDRAQMYVPLFAELQRLFPLDLLDRAIEESKADSLTLYGEGYGARVQKGSGNYIPDGVSFVLFDVRAGDFWLGRDAVQDVAGSLGVPIVPEMFRGTLTNGINCVSEGITSTWGDFEAEGMVFRPATELQDRAGRRIIAKSKTKDFNRIAEKD